MEQPEFAVTHEKSMVIDERLALIATFNFSEKYFTLTRDYGLMTERPKEVAEIRNASRRTGIGRRFDPARGTALLWSNRIPAAT